MLADLLDREPLRIAGIVLVGFVLLELCAFGIAQILVGGTPSPDPTAIASRLEPINSYGVVLAPHAEPTRLGTPRGMGSAHAGVAVVALSEVDYVDTKDGPRRAAEGSTLLAFQVGNWACENAGTPCASWRTLHPEVVIDGSSEALPSGGSTFVAVLPPGTSDVELTIDADGFRQSESLLENFPAESNILILDALDREKQRVLNQTFQLSEHTSIPLQAADGQVSDVMLRNFTVAYVQRRFFFDGATPGNPRQVFLIVNVFYSYPGQTQQYVPLDEVELVDENGIHYHARDLDPDPSVALLGFQVPADLRKATVVIGGVTHKTSTTGLPYTSTLDVKRIPLSLS
ncbi:MAG: hypothetical protein JWQ32_3363 [Marmoricola sp.]|nr:hypothetical protein [Marmoricola sp.]